MDLAAHYQPSQRAGGDYYDFIRLSDTELGIVLDNCEKHVPSMRDRLVPALHHLFSRVGYPACCPRSRSMKHSP